MKLLSLVDIVDLSNLKTVIVDQVWASFGDFNRVLSAPISQLAAVKGVGDAVLLELKLIEAAAHRLSRSKVMQRHVLSSWDALLDYCHTTMAHRATEQLRILFLDTKNTVIADEDRLSVRLLLRSFFCSKGGYEISPDCCLLYQPGFCGPELDPSLLD